MSTIHSTDIPSFDVKNTFASRRYEIDLEDLDDDAKAVQASESDIRSGNIRLDWVGTSGKKDYEESCGEGSVFEHSLLLTTAVRKCYPNIRYGDTVHCSWFGDYRDDGMFVVDVIENHAPIEDVSPRWLRENSLFLVSYRDDSRNGHGVFPDQFTLDDLEGKPGVSCKWLEDQCWIHQTFLTNTAFNRLSWRKHPTGIVSAMFLQEGKEVMIYAPSIPTKNTFLSHDYDFFSRNEFKGVETEENPYIWCMYVASPPSMTPEDETDEGEEDIEEDVDGSTSSVSSSEEEEYSGDETE